MSLSKPLYSTLKKKAKRGFRGYPVATIAFYGPDATHGSKVAVGIIRQEGAEAEMGRWFATDLDIRIDLSVSEAVLEFIKSHDVRSIVVADRIIGCPHEEGIDYPVGEKCVQCPYWANRNRWSGEMIQ